MIGRTALGDLLEGREQIEIELQSLIDDRTNPWGVTVQSVEMRDVIIPEALQDAMAIAKPRPPAKNKPASFSGRPKSKSPTFSRPLRSRSTQSHRFALAGDEHTVRRAGKEKGARCSFPAARFSRWAWGPARRLDPHRANRP